MVVYPQFYFCILYINKLAVRLSKDDSSKSINNSQYADDMTLFANNE